MAGWGQKHRLPTCGRTSGHHPNTDVPSALLPVRLRPEGTGGGAVPVILGLLTGENVRCSTVQRQSLLFRRQNVANRSPFDCGCRGCWTMDCGDLLLGFVRTGPSTHRPWLEKPRHLRVGCGQNPFSGSPPAITRTLPADIDVNSLGGHSRGEAKRRAPKKCSCVGTRPNHRPRAGGGDGITCISA